MLAHKQNNFSDCVENFLSKLPGVPTWSRLMSFHADWLFLSQPLEVDSETWLDAEISQRITVTRPAVQGHFYTDKVESYRFLTGLIIMPDLVSAGVWAQLWKIWEVFYTAGKDALVYHKEHRLGT